MFFRLKKSGPRSYLQIVENRWQDGVTRQHVIATVGRVDELAASGALASLLRSGARFCDQVMLLSALEADGPQLSARRIGAPLLFGRLWEDTGCRAVLEEVVSERAFEFPVERAVFTAVLHRLLISGSDRACEKWMADYLIPGSDGLQLHHFYRAMAWLGEELPDQRDRTPLAPRTVKDVIEERLFERRRDLFTDLSIVFMDTLVTPTASSTSRQHRQHAERTVTMTGTSASSGGPSQRTRRCRRAPTNAASPSLRPAPSGPWQSTTGAIASAWRGTSRNRERSRRGRAPDT